MVEASEALQIQSMGAEAQPDTPVIEVYEEHVALATVTQLKLRGVEVGLDRSIYPSAMQGNVVGF